MRKKTINIQTTDSPFIGSIDNILNINKDGKTKVTCNEYIKETERFDVSTLLKHIYSGNIDMSYGNELMDYISYSYCLDNKVNEIKVYYEVPFIGRLRPFIKKNEFIKTQTNHWNYTKYEECNDIYDDVDIVNCQTTLLEQLMIHNKLRVNYISEFNNQRENMLKIIMEENNINRKDAKKHIISFTYASEEYIKKNIKIRNFLY